jgi:hypothetical protein
MVFKYALNALESERGRKKGSELSASELQVVLKLSRTIFRNFVEEGLIKVILQTF